MSLFKKKPIPKMSEADFFEAIKKIQEMDDDVIRRSNRKNLDKLFRKLNKALKVK